MFIVLFSPQLPQGLSGSQTSQSPPASWISPAHGCSFQSHQFVQSGRKSPLFRGLHIDIVIHPIKANYVVIFKT